MRIYPVNLKRVRMGSIRKRKSLISVKDFAKVAGPGETVAKWIECLPKILGGRDIRELAERIVKSRKGGKGGRPVIVGFGAHVIKCGLGPVLIDLIEKGVVTGLATNGASAVHDFEIALAGKTSEDVARTLEEGKFGMTRETGQALALAAKRGARPGKGFGQALGGIIEERKLPFKDKSVFAAAFRCALPITVHIAIGTDVFHIYAGMKGADIGEATLIDFRIFCSEVCELAGGVYLNMGSCVILPEVFLKAVSVAHNLGRKLDGLVTADIDKQDNYRPRVNVLTRPAKKSFALRGQHEILLPLLHAAVLSRWER